MILALLLASSPLLLLLAANLWIVLSTSSRVHSSLGTLPHNHVGLLLGTNKWLAPRRPNLYFRYRIEAAASLYHAGKIKHIVLSGATRPPRHDEPRDMFLDLQQKGVPADAMTLDPAGFRTLDSIVHSKQTFGHHKLTIITQPFHTYRALYLSRFYGIDAIAFCAKAVPYRLDTTTKVRELLARLKALLDLYILNTQPKVPTTPQTQNKTHQATTGKRPHDRK